MADVIISDEHVEQMCSILSAELGQLEKTTAAYLRILDEILERGVMQGETAEKLRAFRSGAEALAGTELGSLSVVGGCIRRTGTNYIEEIDDADKFLY